MINRNILIAGIGAIALSVAAYAQPRFVMGVDSGANTVSLFDPTTGALVNPNFIDLATALPGGDPFTPKHAMQVGDEIWVSDQVRNRIDRFDLSGTYLSTINESAGGNGLSNIRGMGMVDGRVWLTQNGTANGAPGQAVIIYNTDGTFHGQFNTQDASPFHVIEYNNEVLISHSSAADIQRYDSSGNPLGAFHVGPIDFVQQMVALSNGNVMAAGSFGASGLYEYDSSGAQVGFIGGLGLVRGVYELDNGNIMYATSAGAFVYDINTGTSTLSLAGNMQYLDLLIIPSPGAAAALAMAGLLGVRRRRS
ncbi:MAG: hypothetical protein EA379_06460 [Phycisphaerales bacterium]|nr:MAG: hypothetical protein EA379_06460 [Phycisphaerales bacterium]